ncbi:uracil-DNA glycosylase family protein [Flavobacteriaceae bacterium TK19130]|nr:uracil-DNA glycosylase family protein [Thermobacterium salinum]
MIVGTLPPPRFTTRDFRVRDVDFCYGSRDGQLWPILERIFDLDLQYETTDEAVAQRKNFLVKEGIGICDMVASAKRQKVDASDFGMMQVELRDLISILEKHPSVATLLFTGGNSKNGPEFFFRKLARRYKLQLKILSKKSPRQFEFNLPQTRRTIKTVSLIAPSGAANMAVGSISSYKERKAANPSYTTIDFRVEQYTPFFKE